MQTEHWLASFPREKLRNKAKAGSNARFERLIKRKLKIMKLKSLAVVFMSAAALAAGCNKEQTTSEQLDKVNSETKAAAQDTKDYTFAQKNEFVAKMRDQLNTLNQHLDQLSAKIESSSDAVKADAKPKLQALRDQAAQLNKQLEEARNATGSTWDSVKATSQKAFDSLKDGFQQSRQWVSDKIAP
jgi:cytochrome c556